MNRPDKIKSKKMYKWCKARPCVEFIEVLEVARNLRSLTERLAEERDELQKDLTITKKQLEEAEAQIK